MKLTALNNFLLGKKVLEVGEVFETTTSHGKELIARNLAEIYDEKAEPKKEETPAVEEAKEEKAEEKKPAKKVPAKKKAEPKKKE